MNSLYVVLLALGIVQGIAEFLPISSSGHLVILEHIDSFKTTLEACGPSANLFINVALHVATLLAVIIFLWKDIVTILAGIVRSMRTGDWKSAEMRTALYILAASIPAGVIGMLFNDFFEQIFSTSIYAFSFLIINGIILISTKKIPVKSRQIEEIGLIRSVIVGFFQAIAILPGISRSGMTIAGGLLNGLEPLQSARFSFLMAIPVIAGAGLLEGIKAAKGAFPGELFLPLGAAMAAAVIVALVSLKVLFHLMKRVRIDIFGYYTIAVGIAGVILHVMG